MHPKNPYFIAGLISLSCLFALGAQAAEDADRYRLGEIVVSGEREGGETSETLRTVSAEEIRARGARTLDQALALLPGVSVRVGADGTPRIDIRGFRTRHVVLLLDGVPMNSAGDEQFDPTLITTENIAEIKVISGPSSVLYGQGGLGGVINIVTKKGKSGVQGMVGAEAGDREPYLAKGSVSGASERVFYFLSGQASKVDAFPLSGDFTPTTEQPGGYRKNSDRRREALLGTVGFTPSADLSLGLTVNYFQGSQGLPSSVINDPNDPFANPVKYERLDGIVGTSVQLAAEYAATDRFTVRGWAFLNQSGETDTQFDDASLTSFNRVIGSFQQRITTSIRGLTLQPSYLVGTAGKVTLSLASEWDTWRNSGPVVDSLGNAVGSYKRKEVSLHSAAAEYAVAPLPRLQLVVGYGYYWQLRDERNDGDYSVMAGASYDLFPETRLKAAVKRSIRFPSLDDLYNVSGAGGNDLDPEVAWTYEAGVEQKLPMNSRASVTGFYTHARNLIQKDPVTSVATNLARIDFTGVELAADSAPTKRLLLKASYSYLDSADHSRAGRQEQQYTPGDKVALEAKYDFDCGFTSYASFLWIGNQYFYTKNGSGPNQPVLRAKLNDYGVVNLKLSQKLLSDKVNLYVGANNLLDQNYETSYGFPAPGRFVYGGVEWRL
ncbi:TonB-dependent receptor plug domain-containing protein [Geomesophilobacter sediminis]|uniref:TonB-dependent receptor n=1 Tax=Geomesophilobacter sediminis TaxID=2798584 RepID=A0A8J7IP79_9BACT|nr:TonB-dependent receptor [Geomesophilobacter sediminis]MBJ6725298.1 TonB-dependent receptor [Geomesophilobacter sediminis]